MTTPVLVLWVYMGLLVLGGLVGFLKARSKASLIMSLIFALLFLPCQLDIFPDYIADILLVILLLFFGMRFLKVKKIMPAGVMAALTLLTLILRLSLA